MFRTLKAQCREMEAIDQTHDALGQAPLILIPAYQVSLGLTRNVPLVDSDSVFSFVK